MSLRADMVRQLKENVWSNPMQIVGAIVVSAFFDPVGIRYRLLWIMSLVVAAVGVMFLAHGYAVSFRYDPNAGDPGPRKIVGQSNSVWGEQLAELLKKHANQAEC